MGRLVGRRYFLKGAEKVFGDKTPYNVSLIPSASSLSSALGTFTYSGAADPSVNIVGGGGTDTYAYLFWGDTNSGRSESKTNTAMDQQYVLGPTMYNNGFFDKGTYRFSINVVKNSGSYTNAPTYFYLYVVNKNNERVLVYNYTGGYQNYPYTVTVQFTVNFKFKGVAYKKTNPPNYNHTRYSTRRHAQLVRIKV